MSIPKRTLGRTGLQVTELGLGGFMFTGEFGTPRAEALAILDAAIDLGINFVDVAMMYGFGESEELLARAQARHPQAPLIISTKVGYFERTIARNRGEQAYQDPEAIRRAIEHSFWLLRRERIEVFMVHEPDWDRWGFDYATGEAPVMQVLEEYKKKGLIGAIGMGGWQLERLTSLVRTGRFDVVLVAGAYDLADQPARAQLMPACVQHGVGVVLGAPFRQGMLAVPQADKVQAMIASGSYGANIVPELAPRLLRAYALAEETGIPLPELGLRYLLSDPGVHTVIPGPRSRAELHDNVRAAAKGPLPAELIQRIELIARDPVASP